MRRSSPAILSLLAFAMAPSGARAQDAALLSRVTNAYPAYSPDGSKLAYMSNADGDLDIYVAVTDSGVRRKLTDAPDQDGPPAWSPDGTRIAYAQYVWFPEEPFDEAAEVLEIEVDPEP